MKTAKTNQGIALAVVLMTLVVFGILSAGMVYVFTKSGAMAALDIRSNNKKYGGALAGINRAEYFLRRPDNPSLAHHWGDPGFPYTFTMDINGEHVSVTIEDANWVGY